jgi:hypothetical protein
MKIAPSKRAFLSTISSATLILGAFAYKFLTTYYCGLLLAKIIILKHQSSQSRNPQSLHAL